MALTKEDKEKLITEYHIHDTDTGSADVQVAILTPASNSSPSTCRPTNTIMRLAAVC